MEFKQVILVRQDLKLPKGKLAVQVAHASVDAVLKSDRKCVNEWRALGMPKIVCKVADLDELLNYKQQAEQLGLAVSLITDAGKTTVAPGTITCLGIGPDKAEKIDRVTGKLKIL
ncbi:peptidyl-tRNA hydrolase [Candidatus Woesearchaeota archaeon]|nr:peptidyl-tRNA hydrolase [Candidatus Woesearchaeota archaeon]